MSNKYYFNELFADETWNARKYRPSVWRHPFVRLKMLYLRRKWNQRFGRRVQW